MDNVAAVRRTRVTFLSLTQSAGVQSHLRGIFLNRSHKTAIKGLDCWTGRKFFGNPIWPQHSASHGKAVWEGPRGPSTTGGQKCSIPMGKKRGPGNPCPHQDVVAGPDFASSPGGGDQGQQPCLGFPVDGPHGEAGL
jgi:hypothetical protein